jgi:transcriptional regulator with XRE-family HTH domain
MEENQPAVEVQAKHYAGLLRQAVRAAGFSVSEIERRLGIGPKALRRVFGGSVDLKFKHVIAVLRIIGMSEREFFAIASRSTGGPRRGAASGELLASFERAGYRGEFVPTDDDLETPSAEELDRQVEEAVERVMQRRAQQAKQPPPLELLLGQEGGSDPEGGEPA